MTLIITLSIFIILGLLLLISILFRKVVPTNEVHIVQSSKKTTSYGKSDGNGAVYYKRPSRVPVFGVQSIVLPTTIFGVDLEKYYAYDIGKVPFMVDIKGFFRINDSSLAAERIDTFPELNEQIMDILRGVVRKILASYGIEKIMEARKEMAKEFKKDVELLANQYGCATVNIEFMDIRDPSNGDSKTIGDIMAKKKSLIDKESRIEVAKNDRDAKISEIAANRDAEIQREQAEQQIGERSALKEQNIGIAKQKSTQAIQIEAKTTREHEMEVLKVEEVKKAEIEKEKEIVKSKEIAQKSVIESEGKRDSDIAKAEGQKESEIRRAKGIQAVGLANGKALEAEALAPVIAQIKFVQEVKNNPAYLEYLLGLEGVKAGQAIGVAKADAIGNADTKVIVNGSNADEGVDNLLQVLSGKGGTSMGTMIEAFKQTPAGQAVWSRYFGEDKEVTFETPAMTQATNDSKFI